MLLTVVRHGIAISRDAPDCPPDADRFLTEIGVERTRLAMEGLKRVGVAPDVVLASPYARARQTAAIAAAVLGFDPARILVTEALLSGAAPSKLFEELATATAGSVMCFGHAPHVDHLVAHAVGAPEPFTAMKKAGAAQLEIDPAYPGRGQLVWLAPARMLRKLAAGGAPSE